MQSLVALAIVLLSIFSKGVNSIENLRFHGLWLGAAADANILRFQSTMIIPHGSPDSNSNAIQFLWPGMQPTSGNGVFQNVLANGSPGEWFLEPFYCCNPDKQLAPSMRVYPGDTLTNTFSLNTFNMKWYNNYMVIPGPVGQAAGEVAFSGGFIFDPATNDQSVRGEAYTAALFAIELQQAGQWDFGPLSWRDILIEINTTNTAWCNTGPTLNGGGDFNFDISTPLASSVDGVVRCYIAQMDFLSPPQS
ncbi:hypothetical protein EG329_008025 [Mollisiaceae sp. DMI_Dod_QoI]|nr:hypothetical protein EG329_008025 [Helotiales sp. DMI_Dod_QoI]